MTPTHPHVTKSTLARSAAAIALALAVVGCSGSDDDTSATTATTPAAVDTVDTTPVETAPPDTSPETTSVDSDVTTSSVEVATTDVTGPGIPDDTTPTAPGEILAFGDTAIVMLDSDLPDQLVALTVSDLRAGTQEELAELQVQDLAAGATVSYVDYTVTNISAPETGGDYLPNTSFQFAALAGTDNLVPIIKFTSFEPCENELVDDLAVGASTTTCQIFVSETGQIADQVGFTPDFDTAPIFWQAG